MQNRVQENDLQSYILGKTQTPTHTFRDTAPRCVQLAKRFSPCCFYMEDNIVRACFNFVAELLFQKGIGRQ